MKGNVTKPAEHPAKAVMAKRWEERSAEARARRLAELNPGNSGLIGGVTRTAAGSGSQTPPFAAESGTPALASAVKAAPASVADNDAPAPVHAKETTLAVAADNKHTW